MVPDESIAFDSDGMKVRHARVFSWNRSWVLLMFLVATNLCKLSATDASSPPDESHAFSPPKQSDSRRSFTSMLTVDPKRILSVLVDRGGLLIPTSAEADIRVMRQFVDVESAELNVVEKYLLLQNFTIGMDDGLPPRRALRIGKVHVKWSSYTSPCLSIEVDDVDVHVEFTNLLLSRNNWHELRDAGFPPESWLTGEESALSAFLRFAKIELSGLAKVHVTSRPLEKDIGEFRLDMLSTRDLSESIEKQSRENERLHGRKGITSAELAAVLQSYFNKKLRNFLADRLEDVMKDPNAAMRNADELLDRTREAILDYAGHAGRKTKDNFEKAIIRKLDEIGIESPVDRLETVKKSAAHISKKLDFGRLVDLIAKRHNEVGKGRQEKGEKKGGPSAGALSNPVNDIEMASDPSSPDL